MGASANLLWPAGSSVFEKDSPSEALFVILSGLVLIHDIVDGQEVEVVRLGPGDSFGELSLLLRTTHTKQALALEDTELMVVPADYFRELIDTSPDIAEIFRCRLEERFPLEGEVSEVKGESPPGPVV